MKLRSSLGNSPLKSNKLTALLVTFSLLVALSAKPDVAKAQEKDKQSEGINTKDKYFTQLLTEIQREMKLEEENHQLKQNKQSISKIVKDFNDEVCFTKEKKEVVLDDYLENFQKEISSINTTSQIPVYVDKMIVFLTSLKQKTALIGQEKVSAGSKELSVDLLDTYIARFTAFKKILSQTSEKQQSKDLLSSPSIALLLQEAKNDIKLKEAQYSDQIQLNDSLKQDYTQLIELVYSLESQITSISAKIQEKKFQADIAQKEFSTFESLGTNISEEDFEKKVQLMRNIKTIGVEDSVLSVSLEKLKADLVVYSNTVPVKEVSINQNQAKLDEIQKLLLDEKDKQYEKISSRFKQESFVAINNQEEKIEEQMAVLKKTIDTYNTGIDSLTNVLQKINEEIAVQFAGGENVIKQKEIVIQKLLKEYVKYEQELEQLYSMYKSVLLQNKEAIVNLEKDNSFIKTDASVLENEKEEMERTIESLRVNIDAKEKEKSETKDDTRVISLINELTTLYMDLGRAENSFKQTQKLLKQRKDFDKNYIQKKDKEIAQIDDIVKSLDNNILSAKFAIEAFVYGYNMQLVKMNIKNISVKIDDTKKNIKDRNEEMVGYQDLEKIKREEIEKIKNRKPTPGLEPSKRLEEKNQKNLEEKKFLASINIIDANINSLKTALEKYNKNLEQYTKLDQEQKTLFKNLAILALDALEAHLGYVMNDKQLQNNLDKNNYPVSDKRPSDIPSFYKSIEMMITAIKEAGIEVPFTIEEIKKLYK